MSNYIPIEGRPGDMSRHTLHTDRVDSKKIVEKYGSLLRGGAIGFLGENGSEINVYVGTKASPIRIVIIDLTYGDGGPILQADFLPVTGLAAELEKFIAWLKSQGLGKAKEGD